MEQEQTVLFGPYRYDVRNQHLWRGKRQLVLSNKAFDVLRYLVAHPQQLISKDDLLTALWAETIVGEATLAVYISELRKALGDERRTPRFIETVHGRGYRFIGKVVSAQLSVVSSTNGARGWGLGTGSSSPPAPNTQHPTPALVGREPDLRQLHQWLEHALTGGRQIVFVTGEPGIGKTALVEAFLFGVRSHGAVGVQEREESPTAKGKTQKSKIAASSPVPHTQHPTPLFIAHGQCIEHYGAGEAFLPLLEALGRLCRAPEGKRIIKLLEQYAPTWLVQMPGVLPAARHDALQRLVHGTSRERMLRELAEAFERLTSERPVVLRLEDLHWSDYSTLDWLASVARRQEPARLLIIGTYRPVEVLSNGHPLRAVVQELQAHQQCHILPLPLLDENAITDYLATRLSDSSLAHDGERPDAEALNGSLRQLAQVVHQRTEGNPLFMVNVVDHLLSQGSVETSGSDAPRLSPLRQRVEELAVRTPDTITQMIGRQIDRLAAEEQQILTLASIAGVEFATAAIDAGASSTVSDIEAICARLSRREQFIRATGVSEWPDGTVTTRYSFLHALYQEAFYDRVPAGLRSTWHRRMGERLESAYSTRVHEVAAELAVHFERGRDIERAVRYHQHAAQTALRRSANREAIDHLTKGLSLLTSQATRPEQVRQELGLQTMLGVALVAAKGFAAPEVEQTYARARTLCEQAGESKELFTVLRGLRYFYMVRGDTDVARELGERLLRLAAHDPDLLVEAHPALAVPLYFLGELTVARTHFEQSMALYDPARHRDYAFVYGMDPGVMCRGHLAMVLRLLGYPDLALQRAKEGVSLARAGTHMLSLGFALNGEVAILLHRREFAEARARAEEVLTLCHTYGLPQFTAWGLMGHGTALSALGHREEGMALIEQGIALHRSTGARFMLTDFMTRLAQLYGENGQLDKGFATVQEVLAIAHTQGERLFEAEMYRVKGELTLQSKARLGQLKTGQDKSEDADPRLLTPDPQAEAEGYFLKAIAIAQQQHAKSLELRAVMSLVRLRQHQAQEHPTRHTLHETRPALAEAHRMLSEIYNWFTEGFNTKDLQEAKVLLKELQQQEREDERS
jgi:DNA-binding winged helix-turn-helix (wHTH) protein/tetratricopeptide (TPR) repeat protein